MTNSKDNSVSIVWSRQQLWILFFGFALTVLSLYWRVLSKNFVYDDWVVLEKIQRLGAWNTLSIAWNPVGVLVYRPLAWTFFIFWHTVFGLSPSLFHIFTLLLLAYNGILVARICSLLTASRFMSVVSGILFLSLATLHMDPLLWLVGIYDIGGMVFILLAVYFFLRTRYTESAIATGLALLTKEAAVFVPLLLLVWTVIDKRPARKLLPHATVAFLYLCIKLLGISPFALASDNPHRMVALPAQILSTLSLYGRWLGDAFFPLVKTHAPFFLELALLLSITLFWIGSRHNSLRKIPIQRVLFLLCWIILALLPVLLLKNQAARYYAVHASIPVVFISVIVMTEGLSVIPTILRTIILCVAVLGVFSMNVLYVAQTFDRGIREPIINDGKFHLVKRTAIVDTIYNRLVHRYPTLPRGTTIVITGISLDAIGGNCAPRLWYHDTTLQVRYYHEYKAETDTLGNDSTDSRKTIFITVDTETEDPSQP